jgi:peptide/nickel transport system substrate-binding protein
MLDIRKSTAVLLLAASAAGLLGPAPARAQTLKVAMGSDVKILDPIWSTAYIQRDFGYMVWDVLFALDDKFEVKPEMVETWDVSSDKLTWTFTLRDNKWSNGESVTSEDCIASIRRWGARDSMGQRMMASVAGFEAVDARTFRMTMKESYGLVLQSLGKASSSAPFMMPKKTAETASTTQIKVEDVIGSGPFVFKADEWKPGEKVVFTRNTVSKPRAEPPSGLAGGKVAKVDRVEWIWIPDAQTQVNALQNGEIDLIQAPPHDLLPILAQDKNVKLFDSNPLGSQYEFRFNTLLKPFDNPKIRHAAMVAFGQKEFLKATIGDPKYYKVCKAPFVCGAPLGSDDGMKDVLNQDAAKARELLKEAGYDGTPVVLMQATDIAAMTNLAPVAKAQLEAAGFKVEIQAMDWQTLVARRAKKDPADKGGWNALFTYSGAADILNPVMANLFNASCDKATYGWPCDAEIERLRDAFAKETDPAKQKQIAMDLQKHWVEAPTFVNLGQLYQPSALRTTIDGMMAAPATVLWNITKK